MQTARWHEGDVIRKLRSVCGWKLKDLADRSGVNLQVIHKIESGVTKEAKRGTLVKLAAAFGLSLADLLAAVPPLTVTINEPGEGRPEKAAATRQEPFRAIEGSRHRRSIK